MQGRCRRAACFGLVCRCWWTPRPACCCAAAPAGAGQAADPPLATVWERQRKHAPCLGNRLSARSMLPQQTARLLPTRPWLACQGDRQLPLPPRALLPPRQPCACSTLPALLLQPPAAGCWLGSAPQASLAPGLWLRQWQGGRSLRPKAAARTARGRGGAAQQLPLLQAHAAAGVDAACGGRCRGAAQSGWTGACAAPPAARAASEPLPGWTAGRRGGA